MRERARSLAVVLVIVGAACASPTAAPEGAPGEPAPDGDAGSDPREGGDGGVAGDAGGGDGAGSDFCGSCRALPLPGALASAAIAEASGLAASRVHESRFYVNNDSGDSPRFFAIDGQGADFGTFDVTGVSANDWEDLAVGPCPAGSCVYLGDIGDNAEKRASYNIYRVTEPSTLGAGAHAVTAEALPFMYPDGSHNAETLLVHPVTGVITIVTKSFNPPSGIYEMPMPLTPGVTATLVKRGVITPIGASPLFTGGDVGPRGVLLRTYTNVLHYPLAVGQPVFEALLGVGCEAPAALEAQGEAVAWLADGSGYVSVSEGVSSPVSQFACTP